LDNDRVKLGLSNRPLKAVIFVREKGSISNSEFQSLNNISKATASRDLLELVEKFKLFEKHELTGAGTTYSLKK